MLLLLVPPLAGALLHPVVEEQVGRGGGLAGRQDVGELPPVTYSQTKICSLDSLTVRLWEYSPVT